MTEVGEYARVDALTRKHLKERVSFFDVPYIFHLVSFPLGTIMGKPLAYRQVVLFAVIPEILFTNICHQFLSIHHVYAFSTSNHREYARIQSGKCAYFCCTRKRKI